jgi:hypothetical protein
VDYQELVKRIDNLVSGTSWAYPKDWYVPDAVGRSSLADFYAYVANEKLTSDGVLVVVGYPQLFAVSSQWNTLNRGYCQSISAADADMLSFAAAYLDNALRGAVDAARSKLKHGKIIYESLRQVYQGHELCSQPPSGKSPDGWVYLNGLLVAGNLDSPGRHDVSFHPNRAGHRATATKVAEDVGAQGGGRPSPTPTQPFSTPPVITTTRPTKPGNELSIVHAYDQDWPLWCVRALDLYWAHWQSWQPQAFALAQLWNVNPTAVKIMFGNAIRAGVPAGAQHLAEHPDEAAAWAFHDRVFQAYTSSGYQYDDAVRLAELWHVDGLGAKLLIGVRRLAGQAVE